MLTIAAGSLALRGQTPAPQEFEVASIKPSAPGEFGKFRLAIRMLPGGRISMEGITVKVMIQQAYGLRDFQIIGGPEWIKTERYDITAKPENEANGDQVKAMTQALLASRFQLKFHRETKELPTYALVAAKGGAKVKQSEAVAGQMGAQGGQMRIGRGQFDVKGLPMSALANRLGDLLGRSVIDKTEMAGNYDIKLEWAPEEGQGMMMAKPPDAPHDAPADPTGPSLMTALQEQLGLKLESTKGPVEILAIDRVEKPSEN